MSSYKQMIFTMFVLIPLTGCASKRSSDTELLAIKRARQSRQGCEKEWNKEEAQEEKKFNEGLRVRDAKIQKDSPKSVPTVSVWLYNV